MAIYIGTGKVKDVYLGTSKVKEIYLGTDLVYQSKLYLLKNGLAQSGYTFTAISKDYNYFGTDRGSAPAVTPASGYSTIGYDYSSSYSLGGLWATTIPVPTLLKYSYVKVKLKRKLHGVDEVITPGTFNLSKSNYTFQCLLNASEQTGKEELIDSDPVVISIPITDVYAGLNTATIGVGLRSQIYETGVSADVYDIWLE